MSKPRPFSRPSVALAAHGKVWKDASVYSVQPGDLVRDWGMVSTVTDTPGGVMFLFASGKSARFSEGDTVHAFVKA